MAYKIETDGDLAGTRLFLTKEPANNMDVFSTFTEAKKAYLGIVRARIKQLRKLEKQLVGLRKNNITQWWR